MPEDWTDTAINVTKTVGDAARLASRIGSGALPIAEFIAGFFPGAAPVLQVLRVAQPIIERIATGAPVVASLIESGRPVIAAMEQAAPTMLPDLKHLYAIAVNADPDRPEQTMTAADVSTKQALDFAGPILLGRRWTKEEEQRWFERATTGIDK